MHAFSFHKQRQAETGQKNKQKLSNILTLNFWQKCPNIPVCGCFNEIIWLIGMKLKIMMKDHKINRPRLEHEHKYTKYSMSW